MDVVNILKGKKRRGEHSLRMNWQTIDTPIPLTTPDSYKPNSKVLSPRGLTRSTYLPLDIDPFVSQWICGWMVFMQLLLLQESPTTSCRCLCLGC